MERLAPRENDQIHNYINRHSIKLNPKTPSRGSEAKSHVHIPQDSEISIFDAEKYFNGGHESSSKKPDMATIGRLSLSTPKHSVSSIPRLSSVSDGRNYRARSFHTTPTASSEASWNSQAGLLTNPPGLAPVSIRAIQTVSNRTSNKSCSFKYWFLHGNICPCTRRKSVNVEGRKLESETSKTSPRIVQLNKISSNGGSGGYLYSGSQNSPNSSRSSISRPQLGQSKLMIQAGNVFTFPILSEKAAPANIVKPTVLADDAGETPRDSIEVFQPRESPKSRRASYDDDICSDASSDLFEIESFSTATATQTFPFPRRDSLEDPAVNFNVRRIRIAACNKAAASSVAIAGLAEEEVEEPATPSIAPTECYPPSEVSVDWSVTTAEGFDRASASELGYASLRKPPKLGSGAEESRRKGNGGLLTSCRCEKAVNVGPAPIKYQTETRAANTRTSHRSQPPIGVNGAAITDDNGSHSVAKPTASTLMPVPFVSESLAHGRSL